MVRITILADEVDDLDPITPYLSGEIPDQGMKTGHLQFGGCQG
jgi:hypothetical protein